MLIFVLILILIAILYSTDRGRELLEEILLLPFNIIGYPFKLMRERKERTQQEQFEKEELQDKEKIITLLSKRQLGILDGDKLATDWKYGKEQIIKQVRFFESILDGGQDPRILNLGENFFYIKEEILNKTKKELVDSGKNLTPEILQCIRKEMKDVPLKYEEIRKKFGEMPVVGKQTKNRIVEVLKNNTDLDHKKVDEIIGSILKHFKLNN